MNNMPRTPFSTPLSGSAKETEMRLKNIFSGPKKRPPVLFLILVFSVCLLCGNLVSCQVAEAERDTPDFSASVSEPPAASRPEKGSQSGPDGWKRVRLENSIFGDQTMVNGSGFLTDEQWEFLEHGLPADELPREAVDPCQARRQDYWRDMLLPVAYDEAEDVTVYFVVSPASMPDIEPGASPDLYSLDRDYIVLRHGDRTGYYYLSWDANAKLGTAPMLAVDDFDGDGQPEAALALAWGEGTGYYCECLYIFNLGDPMGYYVPEYRNIFPLKIVSSPDGKKALITSGDQELQVDLTRLGVPFQGTVEAGNQVRFEYKDGQLICHVDLDFSCNTLGCLAGASFPIIEQHLSDGSERLILGPAISLHDIL